MNIQDINKLLNKFYAGKTSPEEEKRIADFLLREELTDTFSADRKLFSDNLTGTSLPDRKLFPDNLTDPFSADRKLFRALHVAKGAEETFLPAVNQERRSLPNAKDAAETGATLIGEKCVTPLHSPAITVPEASIRAIESLIDSFGDETPSKRRVKTTRIGYWAIAIAASLALLFGIRPFLTQQPTVSQLFTDTYHNPDDAYRASIDALQLFSEHFGKGSKSVEKTNRLLEKTEEIIQQTLK